MRVFLVGDIHGDPRLLSQRKWKERRQLNLTPEDIIIFLGDFGLFWKEPMSKEEFNHLTWLAEFPAQVCFIDGNHENFNLINQLPQEEKFGGEVGVYRLPQGKIYHLKRGNIYRLHGKNFFVAGGALSIDKKYRVNGKTWWPGEYWSEQEETNALNNLDSIDWKVDYVLSHTCPSWLVTEFIGQDFDFGKIEDKVARFLEFIDDRIEFKEWHFGHFHTDKKYTHPITQEVYWCHYETIHLLKE